MGQQRSAAAIPPRGRLTQTVAAGRVHGTAAWSGPNPRYLLLYKYAQSHIVQGRCTPPQHLALSEVQRQLFQSNGSYSPEARDPFHPATFRGPG